MSIVHVVGKGGSITAERTLFIGPNTPDEVKILPKLLKSIDKCTLRKFLQVLVKSLEGKELSYDDVHELSDELSEDRFSRIYSGLYSLLQAALRLNQQSLKQDVFREDLAALRIPEDFISDIASVVFGSRRTFIDVASQQMEPHLPKLESFKWQVDGSDSTSACSRVTEPTVFVEMTLSDNKFHKFQVPIKKFHQLRYNVAQILKDMENLEQRSILKIQD